MEEGVEECKKELRTQIDKLKEVIIMSRMAMQLLPDMAIQDIEPFILQLAELRRVLNMIERDEWSFELHDYCKDGQPRVYPPDPD